MLIARRVWDRVDREPVAQWTRPMMSQIRPQPNDASNPNLKPAPGGSADGGLCRSAQRSPTYWHERGTSRPACGVSSSPLPHCSQSSPPSNTGAKFEEWPLPNAKLKRITLGGGRTTSQLHLIGIRTWMAAEQTLPPETGFELRRQGRAFGLEETQPKVPLTRRRRTHSLSV